MRETVLHTIYLELSKAYNALDRDRYLGILVGYGLRPSTIHILQTYWFRLHMASKVGGVRGPPSIATAG